MNVEQNSYSSPATQTSLDETVEGNAQASPTQSDELPHENGRAVEAPALCVTEIVLTCSPRVLHGMVAAYQTAIEQAAGDLPIILLWWGISSKYGHGNIVLEWQGKVPPSFLDSLDIDAEVLDYMVYEDDRVAESFHEGSLPGNQETLEPETTTGEERSEE